MLFNSIEFAIFFPIVTILYFLIPSKYRWILLLLASCVFYMAFVPIYIFILIITICIDYFMGIKIEDTHLEQKRKRYLIYSVISTCLVLFIFKYFNFFNSNFTGIFNLFHIKYSIKAINIILPIGLSFHTFQSLSYVIEVYRKHQKAERHFGIYSLYVMFYPQLVAGPIERPQNLLHQFREKHDFDYARVVSGLRLMAWGLFQKIVIADRLAIIVNQVYANPKEFNGFSLFLAALLFAFQLYCDFAGYSDIAIGSARVMGFNLMKNFNLPYLSQSISEFWKRWHISLSTWFKDYLYIPMGGNRVSKLRWQWNLFFTFLISGLWHGANWTYIIWGALHGFFIVLSIWTRPLRKFIIKILGLNEKGWPLKFFKIMFTFSLVAFAWIFFRADTIYEAWYIIQRICSELLTIFSINQIKAGLNSFGLSNFELFLTFAALAMLIIVRLLQSKVVISEVFNRQSTIVRWTCYYAFVIYFLLFGIFGQNNFIYFQF